jgi:hypothetical protein
MGMLEPALSLKALAARHKAGKGLDEDDSDDEDGHIHLST